MVIVRSKFPRWWRGDFYEQDQKMPCTEDQGRRLASSGTAYYDFEHGAPSMSNTKDEIIEYLESEGIEFTQSMTKSELLELI